MATKEIYRIGIQVGVDGVEESKQKLSAMEKYTQQAEKRLKMLNKITVGPTAKLKDQTSSAIDKINVRSKSLSRAVVSPTAKINDQATSKLDRISTTIKKLENSNITATLRINDQTDSYLNNVQAKNNRLKNTNINPTARVSSQSSPDWNKTKSELMELDGEFRSASVSATKSLDTIEQKAKSTDKAVSNSIKNTGESISKAGDNISKVGDKLNTHVTLPILGAGVASAKFSMDFGNGMAKISTVADTTNISLDELGKGVINLSNMSGESFNTIQDGMYDTISSGVAAENSVDFLTTAVKAAKGGFTDTATSVDGLTTVLNAYGLKTEEVSNIANQMFIAQNLGKTTFGEMSSSMGNVVPTASALKVSTAELFSSLATLTANGIKTSEAITGLKAAYSNIAKPSDDASKMAKNLGLSFNAAHLQSVGWGNFLKEVKEKTHGNTEQLYQLFGSVEAVNTVLTMTSDQGMDLFNQSMGQMSTNTTALDEAFNKVNDTAGSKLQRNFNELKNSSIKLGDALAPVIKEITDKIGQLTSTLDGMDDKTLKTITNAGLFMAALGPTLKIIGSLTTGFGKLIGIGSKLGPLLGITTASGAGIALAAVAALGVGIAGVQTHNELMARSFDTSTDDLNAWEKTINILTGSTIKSKKELVDAGIAYEDFSDGLSGNFKNSVENASKAFNKLKMTLAFDSRNGVNFSDSMSSDIKNQVDSIVKSAKDAVMNKRDEMQNTLSQLFNMGDGKIDDDESKVMDNIAEYQDSKFGTIQSLNEKIYNTLNTAVSEHKKLTDEDIANIKDWTQQIQALEIESSTTNEADRAYASNQGKFEKRLGSMTADEALSSMKDAYNQIININQDAEDKQRDIISKAEALVPKLNDDYNKAVAQGNTKEAEKAKNSIDLIEKKVTEAQDKLNTSVAERQKKTKDLWDAFYKVNPNLQGKMNEINFSKFSPTDITDNQDLNSKLTNEYSKIANTTKTGMKRIKEADGWHDIEVTVDEATQKITSIYDTFNGHYAGYSEEFAQKAKESGDKIRSSMEELQKSLTANGGGIKLDSNNDVINSTTDQLITKLDNVITTADGAKIALANIDGKQIKLEFDKDGLLKNYDDVISALNGDTSSKALVNVDVNDKDAMEKFKETTMAADQIPANKDVQIDSNADQVTSDISGTNEAINETPKTTDVWINDNVTQHLKGILNDLQYMVSHPWTAFLNVIKSTSGGDNSNYTKTEQDTYDENRTRLGGDGFAIGTNNATPGIHPVAEKGFEIVFGQQNRLFKGGEKVLTHEHSKSFLQNLRHDEQFQVQQGQFQLVQPQGKLVTVNVGDIPINVNGNQDNNDIVQEVVQKVGVKLKEALENIKK